MPSDYDIALVSMPWAPAQCPSIQLGILEAMLAGAGLRPRPHSMFLKFAALVAASARSGGKYTAARYHALSQECHSGIGEWIFSIPPLFDADVIHRRDAAFREHLEATGHTRDLVDGYLELRELTPAFLARCVEEILEGAPRVVGFTTTFSQNTASLALATLLKRADPDLLVVFGGANCDAPMGNVLLEEFDCIDVVVQGEAESVLVPLMTALVEGCPVPAYSNVLARDRDRTAGTEPPAVEMDAVPAPSYDEYFATLRQTELVESDGLAVHLPVESARGCWWGEKHHCTFCGLNGSTMKFRSKTADRFAAEIRGLVERYAIPSVAVVDNILDHDYLRTLMPSLAREPLDIELAYEVKANLKAEHVRLLKAAGVSTIQPGIESLSTAILREMDKGTTALQNIRLLKWCAEHGIEVAWNILTGFPGEDPTDYATMAELCPSLFHFAAPNVCRLGLNRNSPMFDRAEAHGIRVGPPLPFYRYAYPTLAPAQVAAVAYFFTYGYTSGKTHDDVSSYVADLKRVVEEWSRRAGRNRNALTYRALGDVVQIEDRRDLGGARRRERHTLRGVEAAIFRACDEGASAQRIQRCLDERFDDECAIADIRAFCDDLVAHRLMCFVDGVYLSLATRHPDAVSRRGRDLPAPPASVAPARIALTILP